MTIGRRFSLPRTPGHAATALIALALTVMGCSGADPITASIDLVVVTEGLEAPLDVALRPGDTTSMFIVEQGGLVQIGRTHV